MNVPSRLAAGFAYLLPIIGWLYVLFFQRQDKFAVYHLRQSIGLVLFLGGVLVGWAVVGWILAWVPFLAIVSVSLFALVIAAYVYGAVAWIVGMNNALRRRVVPLPLFGEFANRLPIR